MKRNNYLFLTLTALTIGILVGCATRVPMVKYHEGTFQTKVQALEHWDLLAKEVASNIVSNPDFAGKTITVNENPTASAFLTAFNQMVKTELIKRNVRVLETPDAPLTLYVQTQLVRHGQRFGHNYPSYNPPAGWMFGSVSDAATEVEDVKWPGLVIGGANIFSMDTLSITKPIFKGGADIIHATVDAGTDLVGGGNPSSVIGVAMSPLQLITGQAVGSPRETASELLIVSLVKEDGIPKMGIKQMVYVSRDEDTLYIRPPRSFISPLQPAPTLVVTTQP